MITVEIVSLFLLLMLSASSFFDTIIEEKRNMSAFSIILSMVGFLFSVITLFVKIISQIEL